MTKHTERRIKDERLLNRVVSPEKAASWITDGMTLRLSCFTRTGDVKAVQMALIDRAKNEQFKVNVFTGASLGSDIDRLFSESGMIHKRLPFQADKTMGNNINEGNHLFVDHHLSHTAELLRQDAIAKIDYCILESIAITDDGYIIASTSIGNSLAFAEYADNIIIVINLAQSQALEGVHDLYSLNKQGERAPIPLENVSDRIGERGIPLDVKKVRGIVFTEQLDSPSTIISPDEETQ